MQWNQGSRNVVIEAYTFRGRTSVQVRIEPAYMVAGSGSGTAQGGYSSTEAAVLANIEAIGRDPAELDAARAALVLALVQNGVAFEEAVPAVVHATWGWPGGGLTTGPEGDRDRILAVLGRWTHTNKDPEVLAKRIGITVRPWGSCILTNPMGRVMSLFYTVPAEGPAVLTACAVRAGATKDEGWWVPTLLVASPA